MGRILKEENRDMVADFIESGDRLMDKFKKLLKECETHALRAAKSWGKKKKEEEEQTAQVMTVESSPNSDENATLKAQSDKILPAQSQSAGPSSIPSSTSLDPNLSSSTTSDEEVTIKEEEANVPESETKTMLGKIASIEFVDSLFERDRQLEATEKFMSSIRLWNILRNPLQ